MGLNFWVGIVGSLVLVAGAAYPSRKIKVPWKSLKNWLFAIGGLFMLAYSALNYLDGGPIFFLILQIFINSTSILMMMDTSDKFDAWFISIVGAGMVAWSLYLFEDYSTVIFILGLLGIGMGYAFDFGSLRREVALTIGAILIAVFSYIVPDWIFFWLNVFFALFSGFYMVRMLSSSGARKT